MAPPGITPPLARWRVRSKELTAVATSVTLHRAMTTPGGAMGFRITDPKRTWRRSQIHAQLEPIASPRHLSVFKHLLFR